MLEPCLRHWQSPSLWPQTKEPKQWQKLPCPLLFGTSQSAIVFGLRGVSNLLGFIIIIMHISCVRSENTRKEFQDWVWDFNPKIHVFTFNITGLSSSVSIGMLVLVTQVLVHKCLSRTYEFLNQNKANNRLDGSILSWSGMQCDTRPWQETGGHESHKPLVIKEWGRPKRYCSALFPCVSFPTPNRAAIRTASWDYAKCYFQVFIQA